MMRPSTINFILTLAKDKNFGATSERKEFLEAMPENQVLQKVIRISFVIIIIYISMHTQIYIGNKGCRRETKKVHPSFFEEF